MSPLSRFTGALLALCACASFAAEDPLAELAVLSPEALARAALMRNSGPAAARAGAEASAAAAVSAGALMDPMLTLELAPVSAFTPPVPFGGTVKLSQRLPFPGQLALQEKAAGHDARAATLAVAELERELRARAYTLFADLHTAERALAVNEAHERLLIDLKSTAEARYAAGAAPQADALQAEVMLAELAAERVELASRRRVVRVQINALLQRPPTAPVPPTPETLDPEFTRLAPEPDADAVLAAHPQLTSLSARVEAADARVTRAQRGWLPQLELMASYSSMWMDPEHRFMIGLGIELPVQQAPRRAQVAEARAMARRMRAEVEGQRAMVAAELEEQRLMAREASDRLRVLRERLVPAATSRLDSVRAGYLTGRAEFDTVIEAERTLRNAELAQHLAQAEVVRRRAALERVQGVTP